MRKGVLILLILALAMSTAVAAQSCTDTDGGGSDDSETSALTQKGSVKYGITTQEDRCLTSENGVTINASKWLKEYYCGGTPEQRKSKVYDCTRAGFTGCKNGACVSAPGFNGTSAPAKKPKPQIGSCGNKIVEKDKGEECDPPNGICFGRTSAQYGTCQSNCKCKIAKSALENAGETPVVCGDGYIDEPETCEEDSDCESGHVCSSCSCVKELTPEEIEAMKQAAKSGTDDEAEEESSEETEEAQENKAPVLIDEEDLTPKNYSETPAMKATSGIANFFKGIFSWIGNLFK